MLSIFKILVVFTLIIILLRRKVGLGITMLVSTTFLGLLFGLSIFSLAKQYLLTFITPSTITLITALVLIMLLESVMRRTGMLAAMTESLFKLPLNPKLLVAAVPAIIGLLPSAGGARFSAPLVGQATTDSSYPPEDKVFINFWFRHIWEYSLPLYPGLVLAAYLSGASLSTMVLWQWPFTIIWAVVGYLYIFRRYRAVSGRPDNNRPDSKVGPTLLKNTWPLLATVAMVLSRVPLEWALVITLTVLIIQKRYPLRSVVETLFERLTIQIVLLTWGTMAFKDVLSLSGAVNEVSQAILALHMPVAATIIGIPLLAGILTGLVQACIGISFPLVMALVDPAPAYVTLAYISAVIGVMISPVHLCFVLTVQYFQADFWRSYKPIILPSLFVIFLTLLLVNILV
ncbi:MAG: DUF401 family protein [Firmicutes bacterium]|nr:DUF401 family protein [Bacillota bacterium]